MRLLIVVGRDCIFAGKPFSFHWSLVGAFWSQEECNQWMLYILPGVVKLRQIFIFSTNARKSSAPTKIRVKRMDSDDSHTTCMCCARLISFSFKRSPLKWERILC
jgi:hypothetical protein